MHTTLEPCWPDADYRHLCLINVRRFLARLEPKSLDAIRMADGLSPPLSLARCPEHDKKRLTKTRLDGSGANVRYLERHLERLPDNRVRVGDQHRGLQPLLA